MVSKEKQEDLRYFTAHLRNVRIGPRKANLVAGLVRGLPVSSAIDRLTLLNKKSAPMFSKLIKSAIANANSQATVDIDRLVVAEAFVGPAGILRRFLPRAQGRATPIRKRSSHITIKLLEL